MPQSKLPVCNTSVPEKRSPSNRSSALDGTLQPTFSLRRSQQSPAATLARPCPPAGRPTADRHVKWSRAGAADFSRSRISLDSIRHDMPSLSSEPHASSGNPRQLPARPAGTGGGRLDGRLTRPCRFSLSCLFPRNWGVLELGAPSHHHRCWPRLLHRLRLGNLKKSR
jgi:hypothetical protein